MKYLCLVYFDQSKWEELSPSERERLMHASLDYDDELRRDGHFLAAQALQPITSAVTVRPREGRTLTTDGPFAETKEQLCGFILIDARDLNQAVQIGSKIPVGRLGCVEVRPIAEIQRSASA
ncbi:MAG: YciI family protein [Myxococcota bacterium]